MLTLLEIAQAACDTLNLDDSPTLEVTKRFVRRRWSLIWGAALWPSSLGTETVTPDAEGRLTLPDGVELALQVALADGRIVQPESELARALLADGTDGGRLQHSWREAGRSATGAPILTVRPPAGAGLAPLTVIVKRAAPALADTSIPTLPGADLALIAHATADLYEWQAQMTLAQTKRQEALALQAQMLQQATNQAGVVTRFIPADAD